MKRIVFFVGTLMNGGAERVISILSNNLVKKGYRIVIMTYYDAEIFYDVSEMVEIVSVEKENKTRNILKNVLWIKKYIRANADVFISFLAPFNLLAILATMGDRIPIIVADRNDPRHDLKNWGLKLLRRVLYKIPKRVIVQTNSNKAYYPSDIQKKISVIFNPIELNGYEGIALKTPKKSQRIVAVGRLEQQKNHKNLITAFEKLEREFPEARLTIYGEGSFRQELTNLIEQKNLEDKIHLPGNEKKIHEAIADAEMFVMTSDYEGMPNALIEAMCLGLPVISTEVSGAVDLIEHRENGVLVKVGDTEGLYDAMRELLYDEEIRNSISQKAVALNNLLHVEKIVNQWEEIINSV